MPRLESHRANLTAPELFYLTRKFSTQLAPSFQIDRRVQRQGLVCVSALYESLDSYDMTVFIDVQEFSKALYIRQRRSTGSPGSGSTTPATAKGIPMDAAELKRQEDRELCAIELRERRERRERERTMAVSEAGHCPPPTTPIEPKPTSPTAALPSSSDVAPLAFKFPPPPPSCSPPSASRTALLADGAVKCHKSPEQNILESSGPHIHIVSVEDLRRVRLVAQTPLPAPPGQQRSVPE